MINYCFWGPNILAFYFYIVAAYNRGISVGLIFPTLTYSNFKFICLQKWTEDGRTVGYIHQRLFNALQRQFRLYIPFLGIARPQPQFPHSCVCERFIYSQDRSTYIFPPAEKADPSWKYIIRSQTHEFGNWDWGPDIPFLGIFVSNFRHFVFAVCIIQDLKS